MLNVFELATLPVRETIGGFPPACNLRNPIINCEENVFRDLSFTLKGYLVFSLKNKSFPNPRERVDFESFLYLCRVRLRNSFQSETLFESL